MIVALPGLFSSFLRTVYHGLFALPLAVIDKLCSVIMAIVGHLLYYFL